MKLIILTMIVFLLSAADAIPQKMGDSYALNVNNIYLPMNDWGVLAEVNIPPLGPGGQFGGHTFLFSGGFFLSGMKDNVLWANGAASSSFVTDYLPGTNLTGYSDPRAQFYRVRSDDVPFGLSWQDWGDAVALGASYYDGNGDGMYDPVDLNANGKWDPDEDRPDLIGNEMLWCVYYDGVPAAQRRWNTVGPQGIEIRQTVFAYSGLPSLENIIFIRYRIKYTGLGMVNEPEYLDSVYFGIWDDPDLGDANDDRVGCDTLLRGGFVYNDGSDIIYGNNPPAFFEAALAGPAIYIPGETFIDNNGNGIYDDGDMPLDTAFAYGGQILGIKAYPGAKNQSLSSSINYMNGDPNLNDPDTREEARYFMLGLSKTGETVDPCTWPYGQVRGGVDCSEVNPLFWYSGDLVQNSGWINVSPGDQRQLQNIGPFKLQKDYESEVFAAYSVGQGTNALTSVVETKNIAATAVTLYNSNFDTSAVTAVNESRDNGIPEYFSLSQNYPNPFNPVTIINYQLTMNNFVTLKVFNTLGEEVATLVNKEQSAGTYRVEFSAGNLPGGVYFYRMQAGSFTETKKMVLLK